MKKKRLILTFCLIAVLASVGFVLLKKDTHEHKQGTIYYCPMHPRIISDKPGDCPICFMKLVKKESSSDQQIQEPRGAPKEKKILYWTDPMIPNYKSDKPGKSPMGMELIPVYEKAELVIDTPMPSVEGHAPIKLDLQKQQLLGMKTAAVKKQLLTKTIRAVGTVAHDPELYQIQVEYIQTIQTLNRAKENGSSPEILNQLERLVEASRLRLRHMGISEELISEMAARKEAEHSLLFAHPGEPIWVYAQVYEYELPLIHVGDEVEVDVAAFGQEIFKGKVRAIDRMVDPMTRTIRIRIQLEDPQGKLKPDMYVNVKMTVDLGEVLAIPHEAVFDTGTQKIVFVDRGKGLFEPKDIVVGAKSEGFYEVKEGLKEGEKVVTSGNFLVDSESRLKAVLEGMDEPSSGGHPHAQ